MKVTRKQRGCKVSCADDLCIIGFDTEYVGQGENNKILSYQWTVLHAGREMSGIMLVDGQRWRLSHLIQHILADAKNDGLFRHYPKSIVLAAHFPWPRW